ncbi:copper chaperone PCu(A)C [Tessaracoccus antarcticus]|uniref:Copper chaperone PCu(A)C n=1 Tax=Tessaracoccus antarcticus TaxID=2479848 RepID=A0A3M0GM29_9ACTN|nr:copper chaperone PCu(A)C [Tessaracoccus antarcticus]RMB58356.1 copper chaperone PCu(A)C [Tessaracoccus antarcticus]
MKTWLVPAVAATILLGACSTPAQDTTTGVISGDPWVRTTDGSEQPDMSALFVNLTNPTSADITLTSADCGDVAGMIQVHEMVEQDGGMAMREAKGGLVVPKESHLHLAPGGPHIMLMDLTRELPAGGEEISCTLTFDDGQEIELLAPVKEFTEEQDTYHSHAPSEDS